MSLPLRPSNRFMLGLEGSKHMIDVIFDRVVVDMGTLGTSLRASFNINISHKYTSALCGLYLFKEESTKSLARDITKVHIKNYIFAALVPTIALTRTTLAHARHGLTGILYKSTIRAEWVNGERSRFWQ